MLQYQLEQEVEELLQLAQSHHYKVKELRRAWVEYYAATSHRNFCYPGFPREVHGGAGGDD